MKKKTKKMKTGQNEKELLVETIDEEDEISFSALIEKRELKCSSSSKRKFKRSKKGSKLIRYTSPKGR
jgi:hypothetical protein